MPKDFESIYFDKIDFIERTTNEIMERLKGLTEEEQEKLISQWKDNLEKSKGDSWHTHINSAGEYILSGYYGEDINIIFPDEINGRSYVISDITFRRNDIESIVISKGVTKIGRLAFAHCDKLKKVMFADGFSGTIMSSAFFNCGSLEEFTFPSNTIIVEPIVNRCQRLETVYIPNSVSEIRGYAFAENVSLKNIYFDGTKAQWKAINKGYRWSDKISEYTVYCQDGEIVTRKKVRKTAQPPQTPKRIVETKISPEEENVEYIYCEVALEYMSRNYCYITDDENICEGDMVVVPFGSGNIEVSGVVAKIIRCTGKNAPYPPSRTKKVLRKYTEE